MRYILGILCCTIIIAFYSCNDSEIAPDGERVGYNYFPLQTGNEYIYTINEIDFKVTGEIDTNQYSLKVVLADSFYTQTNELAYVLYRYTRHNNTDSWTFSDAQPVRRTNNQLIITDNNTPTVRLTFPVENGKSWNANASNTLEEDEYIIDSLSHSFTLKSDTVANTLTVIKENNEDYTVEYEKSFDVYGLNVGLIYSEKTNLEYCTDADCIGQQQIVSGKIFKQSLINYALK